MRIRKGVTLGALVVLAAGLFAGCSGLIDGPLTDLPLAAVPNSIARFPRNDNAIIPPAITNANGGAAPASFLLSDGRTILVACDPVQPDLDCADFPCQDDSRRYLAALAAAGLGDCHGLDDNNDGICNAAPVACP